MKKAIIIALSLTLMLGLAACGKKGIGQTVDAPSSMEITASNVHGVECLECNGVQYPAVFGEPKLSAEEIENLLTETDAEVVADAIATVPDCLLYIRARHFEEGDAGRDPESVVETGVCFPPNLCDTMLYLLAGDLEEAGRIDLYAEGNYYAFVCAKVDGTYYAFDPFRLSVDGGWLQKMEETAAFHSSEPQAIVDNLVKYCDYSPFQWGEYVVSTYKPLAPEVKAAKKAITRREYTDDELQALADQHLTLEEAADKLHTAADASRFLQLSGFYFRDPDVNWLYDDGVYTWSWVRTARFTYELMYGTCGGIADLMNRLLEGDYDEQGYVQYIGAHIFSYFKVGEYYCFCDFTDYVGFGSGKSYSGNQYFLGAYTVPQDFAEPYMQTVFPDAWDNPDNENYIRVFYIQRADGQDAQPISSRKNCEIIPACVQDDITILYLRDGYEVRYADVDSEACRPAEVLLSE